MKYSKQKYSDRPFLSIITRVYKRPVGLSANKASIVALTDKDIEQIFITDHVGVGLLEANRSFSNNEVKTLIEGEYVFLLDDDDFIVNKNMVQELKQIWIERNPDVIFFRMNIIGGPNGDLYPTPETWEKEPKIAHIGGSCFVVKKEIYMRFIHNFSHPRCADFYFIKSVWDFGASFYFLNSLMCQTGRISRGKPE